MTRLVGILSNRPDRLRSCISDPKLTALLPNARSNTAFGLVFFQGDELLHKKRPVEEDTPVLDFVGDEIVTECAVLAYDQLEHKGFHGPDVGPFRFKRWTLGATGLASSTEAMRELAREPLPDFLHRTISGSTMEEIAFARVLSELHEANALEDPTLDAEILVRALTAVRDALRGYVEGAFGLLVSNGVRIAAAGSGLEMASLERRPGTLASTRPGPELRFSAIVVDPAVRAEGDSQIAIDRDLGIRH